MPLASRGATSAGRLRYMTVVKNAVFFLLLRNGIAGHQDLYCEVCNILCNFAEPFQEADAATDRATRLVAAWRLIRVYLQVKPHVRSTCFRSNGSLTSQHSQQKAGRSTMSCKVGNELVAHGRAWLEMLFPLSFCLDSNFQRY